MTAALDLTSNAGKRVRKREREEKKKRLHLWRDSLLEEPGKRRAISLSFSLSIYPSLPLCLSLIKTCRRLGSRRAMRFGWDVKTHGEPKG